MYFLVGGMKNLLKNYKDDMKIWKVFKTTKMI